MKNSSLNKKVSGANRRLFAAGLLLLTVLLACAAGPVFTVFADEGAPAKIYVLDDADIFSDSEEQKLQELCEKASRNCKTDIVVMTLRTGKDYAVLDAYVREIIHADYGYNGSDNPPDAIVYAIDMVSRADRVITSGNAQRDITQNQLDDIRMKAEKKLAGGNYYSGCKSYIKGVERRMNQSLIYRLTLYLPAKMGIAAAVALVSVLIMRYSAKTKMTANSKTYQQKGYQVLNRTDQLINTTVTTRVISTNTGGGSGGGSGGGGNSGSSGGHF